MDRKKPFFTRWGGYLGSRLGEMGGGLISRITGLGDYTVKKNVFAAGNLPEVVNPSHGGTVIRFQEYLRDVFTSSVAGAFKIETFLINAANAVTFPFLSQIAMEYEQYEFEGLLFQFKSMSADALNSVNTALGSVMMATQYDVSDPIFTSKTEMLNYEFSTSCKPSISNLHMIECAPNQTAQSLFYTLNTSAVPAGNDPRLYHLGNFSIATTGFQGTNVNIGELHCTYQVRLLKPKLYSNLGLSIGTSKSTLSGVTDLLPLGTGRTVLGADSIPITITSGTTITFPATNSILHYYVIWIATGGAGVALVYPTLTFTNCASAAASQLNIPSAGTVSAQAQMNFAITTSGNGLAPTVAFSATGTLPTPQPLGARIYIMQTNPTATNN